MSPIPPSPLSSKDMYKSRVFHQIKYLRISGNIRANLGGKLLHLVRFAPFINNSAQQLLTSLFIGSKVVVVKNDGKTYITG